MGEQRRRRARQRRHVLSWSSTPPWLARATHPTANR